MKKAILHTILIVFFFLPLFSNAQDLKVSPAFFSLRNSKLSFGLGFEGSYPSFIASWSKPSDLGVQYKDTRSTDDSDFPYLAGGISFDIYSDNSLIGLLWGANYSISTTTYQKVDVSTDYFSVSRVEFPAYLKFRPGAVGGKNHLWLLFGGIYSLPASVQRDHDALVSLSSPNDRSYTEEEVEEY